MTGESPETSGSGDIARQGPVPLIYVSWGGTGRAASLREAVRRAMSESRPLVYLAVLDDQTFADLDHSMLALLADELAWLLDAQTELTRAELGAGDLPLDVWVRTGDVVELVCEAVAETGQTEILIGAPVPVAGHESVQVVIDLIETRTSCKVTLVLPDEHADHD
jgi:hypothetical protein